MPDRFLKYSPVATNYEERNDLPRSHHDSNWKTTKLFWILYNTCLHFIIFILVGAFAIQWKNDRAQKCSTTLASELSFARDSVKYVDTVFKPGGFTDRPETPSAYFGPPTPEKNKLWASLYDVGMTVITKEEYHQLNVETTHLVGDSENYIVTIEMFHQLHCLDYVRQVGYSFVSGQKTYHPEESEWSKTRHLDHCIDYLRQVIMCHGDLTPITLEIVPGIPALPPPNPAPYKPDFSIKHTCRNFEEIYDFALKRNTSGYKVA